MHDARIKTGYGLDNPLILAARAGDSVAYGRLVNLYQSPLRAFLRRLTRGNHALADDLSQDTFLQAYIQLEQYRGESSLQSWMMGIGYRIFLQHVRKNKRRKELMEGMEETMSTPQSYDDKRFDLERAMTYLSADERAAITLNSQEGLTHEEISKAMDMPLGTVKSHIKRGRDKLKAILSN